MLDKPIDNMDSLFFRRTEKITSSESDTSINVGIDNNDFVSSINIRHVASNREIYTDIESIVIGGLAVVGSEIISSLDNGQYSLSTTINNVFFEKIINKKVSGGCNGS